ncbi:hypothetical protein H8B02_29215 [Bradyrhizobium sp. Pear77]|uniref:hypothetical protein n=1 Tax=Bradyrhizobium altum TaxID=1571202 RepID=UPI001E2EB54A|nr:hypothetical protein [Bradyrhizobium altum]MCC8957370.1 hypothetical protein [Bradyrhizobium altum]
MNRPIWGRLIAVAVVELVIGGMWLFGTLNPAIFAVLMLGVPFLAAIVALPIVYLIKRSSIQK